MADQEFIRQYYASAQHVEDCKKLPIAVVEKAAGSCATIIPTLCTITKVPFVDKEDIDQVNIEAVHTFKNYMTEDIVIASCANMVIFARLTVHSCPGCADAELSAVCYLMTTYLEHGNRWLWILKSSMSLSDGPRSFRLGTAEEVKEREDRLEQKFMTLPGWNTYSVRRFPSLVDTQNGIVEVVRVIAAEEGCKNAADGRSGLTLEMSDEKGYHVFDDWEPNADEK